MRAADNCPYKDAAGECGTLGKSSGDPCPFIGGDGLCRWGARRRQSWWQRNARKAAFVIAVVASSATTYFVMDTRYQIKLLAYEAEVVTAKEGELAAIRSELAAVKMALGREIAIPDGEKKDPPPHE